MSSRNTMRPKALIAGRSFIFNFVFVILNVAGLLALLLGFHRSFEDHSIWLKFLGFVLLSLSIAGLILFKGKLMMNSFARVFVGGIFIVSGLIKANDPIGFSYKLEEYFEDGALAYRIKEWFGIPEFSLESLIPLALGLSIFICIIEIVLGVLLIFRQKMKTVTIMIAGMMLFFTFLTWHTANCDSFAKFKDVDRYSLNDALGQQKVLRAKTDKTLRVISQSQEIVIEEIKSPQCVSDCGCFGDAMKGSLGRSLSPSESFWKDLILLYFTFWLVAAAFKKNTIAEENRTFYWAGALTLVAILSWVFSWFFPFVFALLVFLGSLWLLRSDKIKSNNHWSVITFVTLLSSLVIGYVLMYEPIKDYRPYAVGSNLKKKMNDGIDGQYQNIMTYKNKKTGEIRRMDSASDAYLASKIWKKKDWKYVSMTQKEIVPMKLASITEQFSPFISIENLTKSEKNLPFIAMKMLPVKGINYSVYDKEKDTLLLIESISYSPQDYDISRFTIKDTLAFIKVPELSEINILEDILKEKKIIILTTKDLQDANWSNIEAYKKIFIAAKKQGVPMILLVSSGPEEIKVFRKKYNFEIPTFTNDITELKAIARSNPSMMILKKGVVVGKYPHRATPDYKWLKTNILN